MDKKSRASNWSSEEKGLLCELCSQSDLSCKLSSKMTHRSKEDAWFSITEKINSISNCTRSVDQVKKKWVDIKSNIKKKQQLSILERRKTGGGDAEVVDMEEWEFMVLKTIPKCSTEGLVGGTDTFFDTLSEKAPTASTDVRPISPPALVPEIMDENTLKRKCTEGKDENAKCFINKRHKSEEITIIEENTKALNNLTISIQALTASVDRLCQASQQRSQTTFWV